MGRCRTDHRNMCRIHSDKIDLRLGRTNGARNSGVWIDRFLNTSRYWGRAGRFLHGSEKTPTDCTQTGAGFGAPDCGFQADRARVLIHPAPQFVRGKISYPSSWRAKIPAFPKATSGYAQLVDTTYNMMRGTMRLLWFHVRFLFL
jgi:hypothetical protein